MSDTQTEITPDVNTDSPDNNGVDVLDSLTPELLNKAIEEKEDLKKWQQSFVDKRVKQALETRDEKWQNDKLPKLREEWESKLREELMPTETQEQKELKSIKMEQNRMKAELQREKLEKFAIQYANSHSLEDVGFMIKDMTMTDEGQIKRYLDKLKERDNYNIEKGKNTFLKSHGKIPETGDNNGNIGYASWGDYQEFLKGHPERFKSEEYERVAAHFGVKG